MTKKPLFELIIGSGYLSQPKHQQRIIPKDFLADFRNVDSKDTDEIVEFANSYSFSGYIIPDMKRSLEEKFANIQNRYSGIINRILLKGYLKYKDILTINHDLENTCPGIGFREKINDFSKIERGYEVYTMESSSDEKAIVKVEPIGSFDAGKFDKNVTCMKVSIRKPANSTAEWSYNRIKDGVTKIQEIFPSEKWQVNGKYLGLVILTDGAIKLDDLRKPVSIEMNFRIGKTIFKKDELAATWSPTTGESFIAKRIWDFLNSEYKSERYKFCKICCNIHSGNSDDHCRNAECKRAWDAIRKKPKKIKLK